MSWLLGVVAFLALVLAAWVRAAGSAITQIPRADAHHAAAERVRGARGVALLVDDRARIGPAVGIVCSILLVLAAVLVTVALSDELTVPAVLAVVALLVLTGDVLPRLLGRAYPRPVAYRSSFLLRATVQLGGWAAERAPDENGYGADEDDDDEEDESELELIASVLRF